jgi:hypothetical protein
MYTYFFNIKMMSDADENYDEPESSKSSKSSRSSRSSRASDSSRSSDGIAGLNTNPEGIQAPTRVPGLSMAIPGARSANFGQVGQMFQQQNQHVVDNMPQSEDDDDLVRLLVRGDPNPNDDDVVDRLMRYQIAHQVEGQVGPSHTEQVLNRIQPQPRAYAAQELTQIRQRRRDQRHQQQLRIILQNCDRHRLLRLFASIDRAHDERALRRVLQQLDHILEMPQQISRTRSHSHAFESLRCRTPQARRALRGFISGVRNHLRSRLHAMTARRRPPQTQTQSQSQSRKGGKRQTKTKKRAFKRNKTVKRQ